jgi:hypothetical protein
VIVVSPPCPKCRCTVATETRFADDHAIWYRCLSCGHCWCVLVERTADSKQRTH